MFNYRQIKRAQKIRDLQAKADKIVREKRLHVPSDRIDRYAEVEWHTQILDEKAKKLFEMYWGSGIK